jgi:monoamine oxidase
LQGVWGELEPFIQLNHNAMVHRKDAFGGKPQRYKELAVDFTGHVSELLGKSLNAGAWTARSARKTRKS